MKRLLYTISLLVIAAAFTACDRINATGPAEKSATPTS